MFSEWPAGGGRGPGSLGAFTLQRLIEQDVLRFVCFSVWVLYVCIYIQILRLKREGKGNTAVKNTDPRVRQLGFESQVCADDLRQVEYQNMPWFPRLSNGDFIQFTICKNAIAGLASLSCNEG